MKEEVDRFKERDATVDKELDDELQLLKAKLEKIKNKKSSLATRIKSLQESIETQPCTYQEKKNLLKTIDTLRDDVRLKKENLEHAQKLQLEFEGTLSDERMRVSITLNFFKFIFADRFSRYITLKIFIFHVLNI